MSQETFQNIIIKVYKIQSIAIKVYTKNQASNLNTKRTTHGRV